MTPRPAESAAISEIYELLRGAAIRRQPVRATYDDNPGCFALMLGDESQADGMFSAISSEEVVIRSSRWRAAVFGVASPWRNSARSSCARGLGAPSHVPNGRPALMKWISISTLSLETIRRMGNEVVAAVIGAPE